MNEEQLQALFQEFLGAGASQVRDLREAIPWANQTQQKAYLFFQAMALRYGLDDLALFLASWAELQQQNRSSLTFKSWLEATSLHAYMEKQMKGSVRPV